jgi:hypothetical protein
MIPPNKARFGLIVVIVLLGTIFRLASAEEKPVRLNPAALAFAQQLIEDGRVISDQKGSWRRDQPSTSRNNEFIRAHGLEEYAKWHFGIEPPPSERKQSALQISVWGFQHGASLRTSCG